MRCEICGKEIEKSSYMNAILCSSECFSKHFWKEKVENKDDYLIIEGSCYYNQLRDTRLRGFGGAKFHIRMNDGIEIVTTNLWCQGEIPPEFRESLPDTAKFIRSYYMRGNNEDYHRAIELWDDTLFAGRVDLRYVTPHDDADTIIGMNFFYEDPKDIKLIKEIELELEVYPRPLNLE